MSRTPVSTLISALCGLGLVLLGLPVVLSLAVSGPRAGAAQGCLPGDCPAAAVGAAARDDDLTLSAAVARSGRGGMATTARRKGSGSVTVMTANLPFTLRTRVWSKRLGQLLRKRPDVLLLQEASGRDVPRAVRHAPGRWRVVQKSASAVVYKARKFTSHSGAVLGFRGPRYDRWLTWVTLRSPKAGRFAAVALHMPTRAMDPPGRPFYRRMTHAYKRLAVRLLRAGYPPILGGDWNAPLNKPRHKIEPVKQLRSIGFTTNWLRGAPCNGPTSSHGGTIDGFGYDADRLRMTRQGCLRRGPSDHRPVWARFAR